MHTLSVQQLYALRLAIFDNAAALHHESELLLRNDMYSRAYLLAHFCIEELGKIPILIRVISRLEKNEAVDWKDVKKRFTSHVSKIGSQNGHFYAFGRTSEVVGDNGIPWLIAATRSVPESYNKKNLSTYVDVKDGAILRPSDAIDKNGATKLVSYASDCLNAHRRSEELTNPIVYEAHEDGRLWEHAD
ncbi:AbiV family abortive infection protein [Pseudomonas moraviensis]|uniref:AbiV family abortive infection protein n=1 Tax=Pseudomonas moraviensis TaxID=321662 RepID=UPI0018D71D4E|nr:AbiV family abortive infection protein [Pseudomonas moraviensis]MBH3442347.1 AbiV family abortive infection protein [Pseudomonas moraviensis]